MLKLMSNLLKFVRFQELTNWSLSHLLKNDFMFNNKYTIIKLDKVLNKANVEWVNIEDSKQYPILGIRSQGQGVYLNRTVFGKELTMKKYQKSKAYHLFYCKVRTVKGQWGIVYPEFEDSYGSSNMQYLEIDFNNLMPEYLELLLKVKSLTDSWDKNAIGADGRHFNLSTLLNLKIPLPPLEIQKKLVQTYQNRLNLAILQEQQAEDKEREIEEYLYKELGIEIPQENEKINGLLEFINFKDISIWSYEQINLNSNFSCDTKIKCDISTLENMCIFKKKPFRKKEYEKSSFNYIDIGSINPLIGITKTKKINISKTPSRATQHINTGDLIIATTRPYLRKFAIVDEKFNNDVCSSGFAILKYNPTKYNLEFIKEFLQSFYGIKQLKEKMTGGLYPAITSSELKTVKIPNPDIEIQNKITVYIKSLKDKVKNLKELAINNKNLALKEFEKEIFNEA
jgi:type I restriction enzyme M protein